MHILGLVLILLLGAAIFGPQLWVRHVLQRHGADRPDFPGTGSELAEHLIAEHGLDGVKVQTTEKGDHYDPQTRTVCLSRETHAGKSLTAVAVAAHEVGHALQHARNEKGLKLRQSLVGVAAAIDTVASAFFIAAPVLTVIVRSPLALLAMAGIGIALLAVRVLVHLVPLPVEFDASFGKALPILRAGNYLQESDLSDARGVLRAAALTYVAAALTSLLDLARWIRLLRW
ncbi:MAG: peptidase [Ahrensia sp.]|nr:peptidase [Ahrensia sp.]